MDQISPPPALTQDEVRVAAWAEVREPLELQLAPLGWRALAALALVSASWTLAVVGVRLHWTLLGQSRRTAQ